MPQEQISKCAFLRTDDPDASFLLSSIADQISWRALSIQWKRKRLAFRSPFFDAIECVGLLWYPCASLYIRSGSFSFCRSFQFPFCRHGKIPHQSVTQKQTQRRVEVLLTLPARDVTASTAPAATRLSTSQEVPECGISPMLNCRASFQTVCQEPACPPFVVSLRDRFAQWSTTCGRCRARRKDAFFPAIRNEEKKFSPVRATVPLATQFPVRVDSSVPTSRSTALLHPGTQFATK